jgi:hypothetical protein
VATKESQKVIILLQKLLSAPSTSEHFTAVQAQCAVASEVYIGVLQLADGKNGLAASALVRTLFETIIGAIILANRPEKLQDFGKHGKMMLLRLALSITDGTLVNKEQTKSTKDIANVEYDALYKEFKPSKNWHKMMREDAFKEAFQNAKLGLKFYDGFYGRTSAISHGEPFNVFQRVDVELKTWKLTARSSEWHEKWPMMAEVMSMFLMLHLVNRVSAAFSLGLEAEMTAVNAEVEALAGREMAAARALPDVK